MIRLFKISSEFSYHVNAIIVESFEILSIIRSYVYHSQAKPVVFFLQVRTMINLNVNWWV